METIAQDTGSEVARLRELMYDVGEAVTRLTAELGDAKARIRVLEETLAWSGKDDAARRDAR